MSRRISNFKSVLVGAAGVVSLALLAAGLAPSAAMADEPADPARILFSNGGRIVQVNADGTGRKVLTNRSRLPKNGPYGHTDPKASPDGSMMLFTDGRRRAKRTISRNVVVARIDGTDRKVLLKTAGKIRYSTATWLPDGSILAPYFKEGGRFYRSGLLKIRPDGSGKKKVFELKSARKKRWVGPKEVSAPAVSPDGLKVLVKITDDGQPFFPELPGIGLFTRLEAGRLVTVDLATGNRRKVTNEGFSGDWSPDGKRIVYSQARSFGDDEVCSWIFGCERTGQIKLAKADGTSARLLLPGKANQREPAFSPDGERILFQSDRNLPGLPETNEIYSVRLDGKCLTWLTNGTPASLSPAWIPGGGKAGPSVCGPLDLKPLGEVPPPAGKDGRPGLWAGPALGRILYSDGDSDWSGGLIQYLDCGEFRSSDCGKPFVVGTFDMCALPGWSAFGLGDSRVTSRQRGIPIFRIKTELGAMIFTFTGRDYVLVLGGSGLARKEIGALRPVGAPKATGLLPRPLFPRKDLRRIKKVKRTVKRTGSVRIAAKRLRMKPRKVRVDLGTSRTLKRIGRYGAVNCPAKKSRNTAASSIRSLIPSAG